MDNSFKTFCGGPLLNSARGPLQSWTSYSNFVHLMHYKQRRVLDEKVIGSDAAPRCYI